MYLRRDLVVHGAPSAAALAPAVLRRAGNVAEAAELPPTATATPTGKLVWPYCATIIFLPLCYIT